MLPVPHDNAQLDDLVKEPRETLDIEVKEWLDLETNDHRAGLAKEIIALANHGGGYILIGFEERADGTFRPAQPRPETLKAWSQDNIQSIVARYIDPSVQCRVSHRGSGLPTEKYPLSPCRGGHGVPVTAKAGAPDGKKLVPHLLDAAAARPRCHRSFDAENYRS